MKLAIIFVLSMTASVAAQQKTEPVLLTEAPEGWRFERLDFPLEFAPDLNLEGFEELRFAPGMFDPESDSYFSYVLAMKCDGLSKVDSEFMRKLFQQYFTGLCGAVAKSRDLKLDLDQIKTEIELKSDVYHVTVEMFDAFVTGKRLTLNLQVTTHESADDSGLILLGLASPAKTDTEIWKQLENFRDGFGK